MKKPWMPSLGDSNSDQNIMFLRFGTIVFLAVLSVLSSYGQTISATDIVRKANDKYRGEKSGYSVMTMTIVRPTWQRTIEFKSWSKGNDYSLTLINAPAREKGQTFLKRNTEMWSWNPSISRLIKLPPSMMSQGWMGSDYTNDDILRESSVVNDYIHKTEGEETIENHNCYRIRLTAKKDAAVLWGSQLWWVDKKEFILMKAELYDEDGYLVRTELASDLAVLDGRLLPTRLELIPADNPGQKTILNVKEMKFNISLDDSFFSQQNMKNIR
jgi:outer membrane lipoprotein-sorting protein